MKSHLLPPLLTLAVCAPFAAASVVESLAAPAASSVERVTLRLGELERGADPAVPQLLGTTIVDGDRRVAVDAGEVQLLGGSGADYVVVTWGEQGGSDVERVAADGTRETLVARPRGDFALSGDGEQLFEVRTRPERSVVVVRDAVTGEEQQRRRFRGPVTLLDADEERAVLAGSAPARTFWWHTRTDQTKRIAGREGYFADIRADRVATLTAPVDRDGCSVLTRLTARRVLWRSCDRGVIGVAPDGSRVLTWHLRMDGPNTRLAVHGAQGRLRAAYRTPGWFGPATWEGRRSLLVLTHGPRRSAVVRCVEGECERATRLTPRR